MLLAFRITGRLRVLPLPFALLLRREKPYLGWFPLNAPAIFHSSHIPIDLYFVQGVLLVRVPGFEAGGILLLGALDGARWSSKSASSSSKHAESRCESLVRLRRSSPRAASSMPRFTRTCFV